MVTVVKRPTGHKIIYGGIEASITDDSGDALVTFPYHGLGTGDYVYVDSDIDEYTGFWYVTAIDTDSFKISEYNGAPYVEFFQEQDVTYFWTSEHAWNSIFLPIVYKTTNDKWPVNTIDTARTITSFSDDNGYTQVSLSGAITSGAVHALGFVKITYALKPWLNGVFQIVDVNSSSNLVLDRAYSTDDLVGATIQYYYSNYQVRVKVWGGLPFGHPWQEKKPFQELAELSLTPDENGVCMFSISDYLRGKVEIRNNPTLFSMPLNLDAFTAFYICVGESHDIADGYALGTYESESVCDEWQGWAVTGKLPFKNVYSGDYSDYIPVIDSPAKWLTMMDRLVAVEGKYFDISFIKNAVGNFSLFVDKYVSGYKAETEEISFEDQGIGVYRLPLDVNADYDSYCVTVRPPAGAQPIAMPALSEWATRTTSPDLIDWTTGTNPTVSLTGGVMDAESSEMLWVAYPFEEGNQYTVTVQMDITGGLSIRFRITNDSFVSQFTQLNPVSGSGIKETTLAFTANANSTRIAIQAVVPAQNSSDVELLSLSATEVMEDAALTEEICIDMVESCDVQKGVNNNHDDARLTEDGDYRLLE